VTLEAPIQAKTRIAVNAARMFQGTRVISQRVLETIYELVGATFFPLDESHVGGSRARPPLGFGEPDIQSSFTDVKRLADFEMSEWTS